MAHDCYREGMRVWAWVPDLEEACNMPLEPDVRGWYPAEVVGVDEAAGELFLSVYTYAGEAREEVWTASITLGLEDAKVTVWPKDEPPPLIHEAMLAMHFGYARQPGEPGNELGGRRA